MSADHWLTIAIVVSNTILAITTLLAPMLAVIVQARLSQPKPTPKTNEEKTLSFKIGFWVGAHAGRVLVVGLLWCFSMLAIAIFRLPLTSWSVAAISLDTTLITVQIIAYLFLKAYALTHNETSDHLLTIYKGLELTQGRVTYIEQALWPPPDPPADDVQH
jgi:hypothetical protein